MGLKLHYGFLLKWIFITVLSNFFSHANLFLNESISKCYLLAIKFQIMDRIITLHFKGLTYYAPNYSERPKPRPRPKDFCFSKTQNFFTFVVIHLTLTL